MVMTEGLEILVYLFYPDNSNEDRKDKLIEKLEEYIKMLGEEIDSMIVMASIHGWKSTRGEQGEKLRKEITEIKNETKRFEKND